MRKAIAMVVTLLFIVIYAVAAATIGSNITGAPGAVQLLFYVVAGVAWAFPLKPLMAWMNAPQD